MRGFRRATALAAVLLAMPFAANAVPVQIDFDSLTDLQSVDNVFPGLSFSNATVLTAGISLNELEFPPRSGTNVVFDDGGPLAVVFATLVYSVGGYFNYSTPVTLSIFDTTDNLLASITSTFSSNLALSGDVGSSANEFLGLLSDAGIGSVRMSGGDFTLDDFVFDTERVNSVPVPEPPMLPLLLLGSTLLLIHIVPRRAQR